MGLEHSWSSCKIFCPYTLVKYTLPVWYIKVTCSIFFCLLLVFLFNFFLGSTLITVQRILPCFLQMCCILFVEKLIGLFPELIISHSAGYNAVHVCLPDCSFIFRVLAQKREFCSDGKCTVILWDASTFLQPFRRPSCKPPVFSWPATAQPGVSC